MSKSKYKKVSWFKKHEKILLIFGTVIAVLVICIVLPSLINRMLYWDIKTNNSTDGEWLSFWGSFLGGIFGGLATLGGILITREMAKKDNEELKNSILKEREPKIIPIKKSIYLYKTYENPHIFNSIQTPNDIPRYCENINVKFVNVGKEAAIQIEMLWDTPKNISSGDCFTDEDVKVCKAFLTKFGENGNIKIEKEYIVSLEEIEMSLNSYTEIYIKNLVGELIDNFRKNNKDGIYIRKNIPVGTIYIKCKNIYDEISNSAYYMEISIFEGDRSNELYTVYIEFKLKNDRD